MWASRGFDDGLPSVYRCLARWPALLNRPWDDLEPEPTSAAFADAVGASGERRL